MRDPDIKEMSEHMLEIAMKLLQDDKYLVPVVMVVAEGTTQVMPMSFSNSREKHEMFGYLNNIARVSDADALIFVCDSMVAVMKVDEYKSFSGSVGDTPGHDDCIIVSVFSSTGESSAIIQRYVLEDNGDITFTTKEVFENVKSGLFSPWKSIDVSKN